MSKFADTPKPVRYTRTDVVETALRLLDELGLQDLSMRRLAQELDIQPSALYWHVANKQTLLALVSDQIISRGPAVETTDLDWKSATLAQAIAVRDALLAFRDGAEVVSSTLALGLGAGEALERIKSGLTQAFEDESLCQVAAESILFLVLGQVWHQQQRMQASSLGLTSPDAEIWTEGALQAPSAQANIDTAEMGVRLLLDGLAVKHLSTN
ncbi:MAG: TetR family transcriptional regulator [Actinomycetales bacterium]|nr:TetR family transcriptional regulator [Actinomycetales bacterium]